MVTAGQLTKSLSRDPLVLIGQFEDASNGVYLASTGDIECVYKPTAEESPLWDFPNATLGIREALAGSLSAYAGWNLVPTTIFTNKGPLGPGSVQLFHRNAECVDVGIFPIGSSPENWFEILQGEMDGAVVDVSHAPFEEIRRLALFDALINNADRKAGHILRSTAGKLIAIDQGVCFHHLPKLRTVLWGFTGEPLLENEKMLVETTVNAVRNGDIVWTLSDVEREAFVQRAELLIQVGMPAPSDQWPAIPWPIF
jgi:uncharacterized repeat protein (TIGR03843 family)